MKEHMNHRNKISNEEEYYLDSFLRETSYVCVNCLTEAEVDEDQTYIYCEICETFNEVKKKGFA